MLNWLKKNKKKIILLLLITILIIVVVNYYLKSQNQNDFVVYQVESQDLIYSLSESGSVKQGNEVFLSFNQSGQISQMFAKEGDWIRSGKILASLDKKSLLIDKERAQESLSLSKADYQRLMAGLSLEELHYYQVALDNTEIALNGANDNLEESKEIKVETEIALSAEKKQLYDTALSSARQSVDAGLSALLFLTDLQTLYFAQGTQESLRLAGTKGKVALSLLGAENASYWSKPSLIGQFGGARKLVREAESFNGIDLALEAIIKAIQDIKGALDSVSLVSLSLADITLLNSEKTTNNTTLATLTSHQQALATYKISRTNSLQSAERAIRLAERQVATAQGSYDLALAQLEMKTGSPREEDQALYLARIRQAEVDLRLAEQRVEDSILRAPFAGQVIDVLKNQGEIAQPGQAVVKFRPQARFQVELEVYEGEIGRVRPGQLVEIELVAFPDIILSGQVSFINPLSRLVNNVVYYPVIIEFDELFDGLKAGLTADVKIIVDQREDVLVVPEASLINKDGQTLVRVLVGEGTIEERLIEVGLRGDGFRIEVLSGLKPDERVIVR